MSTLTVYRNPAAKENSWSRYANGTAIHGGLTQSVGRFWLITDEVQFGYHKYSTTVGIPAGDGISQIDLRVRTTSGLFNDDIDFAIGLLVPDGKWDSVDGFNSTDYPTWQSMPRPTNNSHTIQSGVLYKDRWLGFSTWTGLGPVTQLIFGGVGRDITAQWDLGFQAQVDWVSYIEEHGDDTLGLIVGIFEDEITGKDRNFGSGTNGGQLRPRLRYHTEEAPVITSTPVTTGAVSVPYTYDVDAAIGNPFALVFSLDVFPTGMTINSVSGEIDWTPGVGQDGLNDVTVVVKDGDFGVLALQSYQIDVVSNTAPTITSSPILTGQVGFTYTYDVDATDPELDTLTFSLQGTPPTGMIINSVSGVITWFPVPGQEGSNSVTVRATDPGGLFDEQIFSIEVDSNTAYIGLGDLVRRTTLALGDLTREQFAALGDLTREQSAALGDLTREQTLALGDLIVEEE